MKRIAVVMIVFILAGSLLMGAADERKKVAILDFDFSSVQPWWGYHWDIGKGVSDLIVKELVTDGTFRVIERRALDAVLAEQNFSNSDRANPSTAAAIGKVLGVDAIILGSITQFGVEDKKFSIGGFGRKIGGFGVGKVGTKEGKAKVVIDARIVDINTAEILGVSEGEGESKRSGLLLAGAGGGSGGSGGGALDMGSSNFKSTILGEATSSAVTQLSEGLVQANSRIPTTAPVKVAVKGMVAFAQDSLVIVNVGSDHGVAAGMELSVERVSQVIKDPATGKVLRELTDKVGTIKVTKVDAGSAEATAISGSGFKVGDVVRN